MIKETIRNILQNYTRLFGIRLTHCNFGLKISMDEEEIRREIRYSNEEITVIWKPWLCMGSTRCWRGLPEVFHHGERPWVTVNTATAEKIAAQIDRCP